MLKLVERRMPYLRMAPVLPLQMTRHGALTLSMTCCRFSIRVELLNIVSRGCARTTVDDLLDADPSCMGDFPL